MAKKSDTHASETNNWVDADPDVVYAFEQGISFGAAHSGRKVLVGDPNHGPWTPDEWRAALKATVDHMNYVKSLAAKAGK